MLDTKRFRLTPDSAARMANNRCTSGGTRTRNFPLNDRAERGSGTGSLLRVISATDFLTKARIPCKAFSGDDASQLRLGNSAHSPTCSSSSSDQVTLYVYRSAIFAMVLHSLDGPQHLPHLIRLCLTPGVLNVDAWVAWPRRAIHPVTCSRRSRFPEIVFADPTQIFEADPLRALLQLCDQVLDRCQYNIVSIMILVSRDHPTGPNTRHCCRLATRG